jgi:predicted transcriptional regulator of viral defense system
MQMKNVDLSLSSYVDSLQMKGRYTFTREEALTALQCSYDAFRFAILRLLKKKRLIRPRQGFYVLVPIEYQAIGSPPPTWFIDSLMHFYQQPYYVGLLSAAALYGAAHQQPQAFQVITSKPLRAIEVERIYIQFFTKKQISDFSHQSIKTTTGYLQVSIPEMTAFDLVQYVESVGHLNNVATVLTELHEKFSIERFKKILATEKIELPYVQRLGYLLEYIHADADIIDLLKNWLKQDKPRFVPLQLKSAYDNKQKNADWHLYINENIEMDL